MTVTEEEIYNYLANKGVPDFQARGILSNLKAESGLNPGAIGDGGTSGGLFQHHNERFTNMKNFAGPDWATDWQGQIDYGLSEPEGKSYLAQQFADPAQASQWFTKNYERPANANVKAVERLKFLNGGSSSMPNIIQSPSIEQPEPEKKGLSKVLPLLLRFALPTLAAGVLGGKSSIGAFPGALSGLASAGLGHLGTQANEKKNKMILEAEKAKTIGDWNIEVAKANQAQANADRTYDMRKSNIDSLIADRDKVDPKELLPEQKFLESMKQQLKGRPATEQDRKAFAQALLLMKGARKETDEEGNISYVDPYQDQPAQDAVDVPWYQWGVEDQPAQEAFMSPEVTAALESYNRYLGANGTGPAQGFALPPWINRAMQSSSQAPSGYKSKSGYQYQIEP